MPSYAFAIGNVRMYLRIGPKTRTNRRFSKTRPDAQTKAKKEDVSGETRTYGNPIWTASKNGTDVARCNFDVYQPILITSGRNFADRDRERESKLSNGGLVSYLT